MKIGVGLPTGIPEARRDLVIEWAARADQGPFSCVGVIDRLAYDSIDPFIALSVAAAVTRRVRLLTTIAVGPLRTTALLAKAAASLHAISGGRVVLGLGIGAREEDYDVAGIDHRDRGRRLSEQLIMLPSIWKEKRIGPVLRDGVPTILVGGLSDEAFARAARYADGYIHGGGPPRAFARAADRARAAWIDAGRPTRLQLWGQGYFALGEEVKEAGLSYMRHYYAFAGSFAERIAAGLLTTPQAVTEFIEGYAQAGCDELILLPAVADLAQLHRLAEIIERNPPDKQGRKPLASNP